MAPLETPPVWVGNEVSVTARTESCSLTKTRDVKLIDGISSQPIFKAIITNKRNFHASCATLIRGPAEEKGFLLMPDQSLSHIRATSSKLPTRELGAAFRATLKQNKTTGQPLPLRGRSLFLDMKKKLRREKPQTSRRVRAQRQPLRNEDGITCTSGAFHRDNMTTRGAHGITRQRHTASATHSRLQRFMCQIFRLRLVPAGVTTAVRLQGPRRQGK